MNMKFATTKKGPATIQYIVVLCSTILYIHHVQYSTSYSTTGTLTHNIHNSSQYILQDMKKELPTKHEKYLLPSRHE